MLVAIPAVTMADGTSAVVVNQNDGSDLYRLILQIRREMGDTVDTTNAAVAVSSCNACQTVAVALQGVLVMSDPSVFIPENLAMAININCDLCQTLAIADQTLIQTGGPARLTADGSRRVAEIRRQLEALRNSGLTIDQIQQQVAQLNTQLQTVLLTEVVLTQADLAGTADDAKEGRRLAWEKVMPRNEHWRDELLPLMYPAKPNREPVVAG